MIYLLTPYRWTRSSFFQNIGASLLFDGSAHPVLITLPSLTEPFTEENERSYFLMFLPAKGAKLPKLDRPYGIKRRTYSRLCMRIERLEQVLIGSRLGRRGPILIAPLSY
jgi:hypothetical protein